ncbi:MAG: hypothetical protein ACPGVV_05385, partial [Croceimicrobium sp.]
AYFKTIERVLKPEGLFALQFISAPDHRYDNFRKNTDWIKKVNKAKTLLSKGIEARDQISILGDDSVPLDYHLDFWKSELIDFAFIQQDSFDAIDMNSSLERQSFQLNRVLEVCDRSYEFEDFGAVSQHYKKLINLFKQMNYSDFNSEDLKSLTSKLKMNSKLSKFLPHESCCISTRLH